MRQFGGSSGQSYNPEKTLNVIQMFAGTEDMFEAIVGLVKAIFGTQGIDPKLREMIILRAAAVLNAPHEWQANTQMAKNAALSSNEIDEAGSDGPVAGINPEYVLICKATDELSKRGTLRDETLGELLNRYGDTIIRRHDHTQARFDDCVVQPAQAIPERLSGPARNHRQDWRRDLAARMRHRPCPDGSWIKVAKGWKVASETILQVPPAPAVKG
jgi:Carboxymuconolactone decarboxylase family